MPDNLDPVTNSKLVLSDGRPVLRRKETQQWCAVGAARELCRGHLPHLQARQSVIAASAVIIGSSEGGVVADGSLDYELENPVCSQWDWE